MQADQHWDPDVIYQWDYDNANNNDSNMKNVEAALRKIMISDVPKEICKLIVKMRLSPEVNALAKIEQGKQTNKISLPVCFLVGSMQVKEIILCIFWE